MATIDITDASVTVVHRRLNRFRALVQRYHADPDCRRQVEADPVTVFREQGLELPSDIAVRVLVNTDDTRYVIMPPDPNVDLDDEMLAAVAGGATLGTAGTVSTATSVGSSMSTVGCTGTAGSAG